MKRTLLKCLALVWALVATQSASAIPFKFEVKASDTAVGVGTWSLVGPTTDGGVWIVGLGSSYTHTTELTAGEYTWSILGLGGSLGGLISWTLSLGGVDFYSGSDGNDWVFKIFDTNDFTVGRPVSVPEPSTLALLGIGLLAVGFSVRRRRRAAAR